MAVDEALLRMLVEEDSPSGAEDRLRDRVLARFREAADRWERDVHGNLILTRNPGRQPVLMMAAHMDEIGLMVTHIEENGYLRFQPVGGLDPCVLPGARVRIRGKEGPVYGVIGKDPVHFVPRGKEREQCAELLKDWEKMWVDIGAESREEAQKRVAIGDSGVVVAEYGVLSGSRRVARAFDDRVGVFVMLEVFRQLEVDFCVHAVCTVQEELGMRGAVTSAYRLQPDFGLAIEVGFATDYPGASPRKHGEIRLGGGPILHRGPNIHPAFGALLEETAREKGIPFQQSAAPGPTGTDAWVMQVAREGVATALISIPLRYMHTPSEVLDLRDVEAAIGLLREALPRLPALAPLTRTSATG